ncbi:MAG: ECF-type sigma factor [Planctomycetaceae bacterium]
MADVTQILSLIQSGNSNASEQLLPLVYAELRNLAAARMASERLDHTLQPTALVHEAYVRLVNTDEPLRWESRGHFFAAAAEAMRRILVEHARRRLGKQRGGNLQRIELHDGLEQQFENHELVLQVSEALERLVNEDAQAAELVKLHCFAGFSIPEAAEILGIASSTAYAHWSYAKAMMGRLLSEPAA